MENGKFQNKSGKPEYQGIKTFEVAMVTDTGVSYNVEKLSWNTDMHIDKTMQPSNPTNYLNDKTRFWYLNLNSAAADKIRQEMSLGHDIQISKNWDAHGSKEVLLTSIIVVDNTQRLETQKRIARRQVRMMINPHTAQIGAMDIYGFMMLNNKFILNGFVFDNENRSLKYMDVLNRSEELADTDPELSEDLAEDLEEFIDYNDKLSRVRFIWLKGEKTIQLINSIHLPPGDTSKEAHHEKILKVRNITDGFIEEIMRLNTRN